MIDWDKLSDRDVENVIYYLKNKEIHSEEVKETLNNSIEEFIKWLRETSELD